ncbi:hypothetical protein D3C85_1292830 [compost metagenome]
MYKVPLEIHPLKNDISTVPKAVGYKLLLAATMGTTDPRSSVLTIMPVAPATKPLEAFANLIMALLKKLPPDFSLLFLVVSATFAVVSFSFLPPTRPFNFPNCADAVKLKRKNSDRMKYFFFIG